MNNLGFFRVLGFTAMTLIAAAVALQATAAEIRPAQTPHSVQWIWSATSLAANNATAALAAGRTARAIRLANTVAETAALPSDRLIALHNLCLARLAQGDIARADTHCRTALVTSDSARITRRRGGLITVGASAAEVHGVTVSLTSVIRTNIAGAYGAAVVADYADMANAAPW